MSFTLCYLKFMNDPKLRKPAHRILLGHLEIDTFTYFEFVVNSCLQLWFKSLVNLGMEKLGLSKLNLTTERPRLIVIVKWIGEFEVWDRSLLRTETVHRLLCGQVAVSSEKGDSVICCSLMSNNSNSLPAKKVTLSFDVVWWPTIRIVFPLNRLMMYCVLTKILCKQLS